MRRRWPAAVIAAAATAAGVALFATRTPHVAPRAPESASDSDPGPAPAETSAARPAPPPGPPPPTRDAAGEVRVEVRADTVLAYVDGDPLTGLDLDPALAGGEPLPIRRDVLGSMVESAVERSLAAQEARRLGLAERSDVHRLLAFVDEGLRGVDDMSDAERDAYARFLHGQRLEHFYLQSVGADRDAVLDDWIDRLVASDRDRYAAISAAAADEASARSAVRDAVARDFTSSIEEEIARRRREALSGLRRAVRIVVVDVDR